MKNSVETYSTKSYNLTEKEASFIETFLSENGCGAKTPEELLDDNFSCQSLGDLSELYDLNKHEIAGLLSSLQNKGVLWLDDRDGPEYTGSNRMKELSFEPDLYWVSDEYLEELDKEVEFF